MKIYVVIGKEGHFNDEFSAYLEPERLDQDNPGQVFFEHAEAIRVARARNHAALRGFWLDVEYISFGHGLGFWGSTGEQHELDSEKSPRLLWYENPIFDVLHPMLARWNTSLKDFDWRIPADAAPEDLDVLMATFDLERYMVLEAEIADSDWSPALQDYVQRHGTELGKASTPEDKALVRELEEWLFRVEEKTEESEDDAFWDFDPDRFTDPDA